MFARGPGFKVTLDDHGKGITRICRLYELVDNRQLTTSSLITVFSYQSCIVVCYQAYLSCIVFTVGD